MSAITAGTEPAGWGWVWDMVRAPAYFHKLAERTDIGRGLPLDQRVAMLLASRQRVAERLEASRTAAPVPDVGRVAQPKKGRQRGATGRRKPKNKKWGWVG